MYTPIRNSITAQDKEKFVSGMIRFIRSGFRRTLFTKFIYNNLSSCFLHIAHFNIQGFYDEWFSSPYAVTKWFDYVLSRQVYGDPAYTRSDCERAILDFLWSPEGIALRRKFADQADYLDEDRDFARYMT